MTKPHNMIESLKSLAILEALLVEGNVTHAAQRLEMTQPALSHALMRLRKRLGDPLFVRTPGGMKATPFVEELADPLHRSLAIIRNEIYRQSRFDPLTSERVFKLYMGEIGTMLILPPILKALAKTAPGVRIDIVDTVRSRLAAALEQGELDIAIGYNPNIKDSVYQQTLSDRRFLAIVRSDHPSIGNTMTMRQLVETPHIVTSRVDAMNEWFEQELKRRKVVRRIALRTPHLITMAHLAAATDWIALVPEEMLATFMNMAPVRPVKLPLRIPPLRITQSWHERHNADPGHQFLRRTVFEIFRQGKTEK